MSIVLPARLMYGCHMHMHILQKSSKNNQAITSFCTVYVRHIKRKSNCGSSHFPNGGALKAINSQEPQSK